jgi:MtrB/PioB family decaheme-associated outer membrane protein
MRNRLTLVTAALLLASATLAAAQTEAKKTTTPATAPAVTEATPSLGTIDFGFRATSTTGDEARYERYRDLRTGANINFDINKSGASSILSLSGSNVGYHDQRYLADFQNSKLKFSFIFDQIPTNYGLGGVTKTPWTESSTGVWTLDAAARKAVEAKAAVGVLCAPGLPAVGTCNGLTAPTVLTYPSIYRGLATDFDIVSRRDTLGFGLTYAVAKDVDVDVTFSSAKKSGNQPYGMSFAFNNANELPMSLDNRTNDFGVGLSWGNKDAMLRVAYERSMFNQKIESVTWDNPIRYTDWNDGQPIDMTGNGPWDPSAYSNGNGPARGRIAMAPSNTFDVYSATGVAKMPAHTTLNGYVAFSTAKQNAALIPWTINPVIATAATYPYYPGLAALPRSTAEGQVDGLAATFNLTTRPAPWVTFAARYRYSDRKDRTPEFSSDSTVRFDGVPEGGIVLPAPYAREPWNLTRTTMTADATFTPIPFTALKLGVGKDKLEHSTRAFEALEDTTVKASLDTMGNQYVQVRLMLERTRRLGTGFDEAAITDGGGQAQSRWFDDADRTRDRQTLLVTLSPASMLDITASYTKGKDVYDETEQVFGLLDNSNTSTNVGVTVTPSAKVAFGANYGQDKFDAFQASRTANPYSGVPGAYESWTDENRDWSLDNSEKVNNFDLFLDLIKALPGTDIKFGYTMSDSDNSFVHGGPRIVALQNNAILTPGDTKPCAAGLTSCFEALPNVTNTWRRLTADARFDLSKRIGIGVTYWYEKFDVSDFAAVNLPGTETPRIDYLGGLTTGYGNRPYKGSTGFVRVFYLF